MGNTTYMNSPATPVKTRMPSMPSMPSMPLSISVEHATSPTRDFSDPNNRGLVIYLVSRWYDKYARGDGMRTRTVHRKLFSA